jgi:anti-sigma factor RsiW
MSCTEALRVQEYFDGELDASAAVAVEQHLESCAGCATLLADLDSGRKLLRDHATYFRADDALRDRIANSLRREEGERPTLGRLVVGNWRFLSGAASGSMVTALAAVLAIVVMAPPAPNPLVGEVMNAHLRSMMSDHLVDVVSSDRHTVKPWFAGHTDVSPPAVDFASDGYKLVGGRADYVDGHRSAVVVYRHGAHVINVFAWTHDNENLPATASRNGYRFVFWKRGNLDYGAVSDTGPDELLKLAHLVQNAAGPDVRS